MTASDEWAEQLAAWAIPQQLLDAVDESPYGWPQSLWKRRSEIAREETEERRTARIVRGLLGPHGSLVDIGAGRGRASLEFAAAGHRLVAVEKDPGMAEGLREDARAAGVSVTVVEERWPEAEPLVPPSDVVMSAHVVYDVPAIGEFVDAAHRVARTGVVIELTPEHPWAPLSPYYRALHDLGRPDGPTADTLAKVVEERTGIVPATEHWDRPGQMWFESWDEIIETYGRRLVVPEHRWGEVRAVLEPDVTEHDGRMYVGNAFRELVTIWWKKTS